MDANLLKIIKNICKDLHILVRIYQDFRIHGRDVLDENL